MIVSKQKITFSPLQLIKTNFITKEILQSRPRRKAKCRSPKPVKQRPSLKQKNKNLKRLSKSKVIIISLKLTKPPKSRAGSFQRQTLPAKTKVSAKKITQNLAKNKQTPYFLITQVLMRSKVG